MGRASTAARSYTRGRKESEDVQRASETVEVLRQRLADLEAEFQADVAAVSGRVDPATEEFETVSVRPKKTNINVRLVALAWAPHWRDEQGGLRPSWE
jgi:hypothetical protein